MNSLALLHFEGHNITIHGTQNDPLIKCTDLLIHVLGYKQCNDAKWFRQISNDLRYTVQGETPQSRMFTETGVYRALMRSNKPIAEQFQEQVCNLLKKIRLESTVQLEETKQQLEEAKTEIEELKKPQHASVYTFKIGDRLLYVGKDTSKAQNRYSQHFTTRRQIVANYQQIDIFMATQEEQDIKIEVVKCLDYEATQMEMQMIQNQKPECNQVMTDKRYKCTYQGCTRVFQLRVPFEKHLQKHGYMPSDSETL